MDSINVLDPSYGNPTDGTGSLVSNQIKFKKESRNNIERVGRQFRQLSREGVTEQVANQMIDMSAEEVERKEEAISNQIDEVKQEIVDMAVAAPIEETAKVLEAIKEKSDYAKRLEERIVALETLDADKFVSTLKPIAFHSAKPLKIKPGNYSVVSENVKKAEFVEAAPQEEKAFEGDITAESFEQAAPAEEEEVISEPIVNTEGFMPEAADMNGVSESFSEPEQTEEENVMEIKKDELTEEDISKEIYGFIQAQEKKEEKDPLVDMDSMVKSEEEKEEVVVPDGEEIVVPETVTWEPTAVVEEEENVREVPEIAPEREEAIVPIMEMEDSVEKEEVEEEKEELSFDYSDVTEKDIESTNSIAILEEMRKAKEKKLKEKREAEEKAAKEEKALVVSREEASKLRKKAEEAEKAVQAKMQEFQKYIDSYDEEIEEANKRREKAANDKAETDEEIAKYQASISSNADIEKELESMMTADVEEEKSTKKGK